MSDRSASSAYDGPLRSESNEARDSIGGRIPSAAICILSSEQRYVAANDVVATFHGIEPSDHVGKTVREVLGPLAEHVDPHLQNVFDSGRPVLNVELSCVHPATKKDVHWRMHFVPLKDEVGKISRAYIVVIDVAKQSLERTARSLDDLRTHHDRLQVLSAINALLSANWDIARVFGAISAQIGEIPLDLQPKLLRVLQDHEFERLGSNRTIKVNLRMVAATNRDLPERIAQNQFRSDLYYRLSVFPIVVPPLRERKDDIPLLVRYFVQFNLRIGHHIESVSTRTMNALQAWSWPGNIRELENLLERSVILSEGSVLRVPLAELRTQRQQADTDRTDQTLDQAERQHILRVLRETNGKLSGPDGAAERLGLKRTTLQSKMRRLKIARTDYTSPK